NGKCLIAYSGGVDSTFLLKVAREELGNKVIAVTVKSEIHHLSEITIAKKMVQKFKVKHLFMDIDILSNKEFINNPKERCYICKKEIFSRISEIAKELNLNFVADGSNYDDLSDYRPGMKAVRELKIRSPLQEAFLTKDDIRLLSKEMDLPTWNKPSNSCLATRIPYGDKITLEKLKRPKIFIGGIYETIWTPGEGTLFNELITLAGGRNIAASLPGWAKISPEFVAKEEPEIIIIPIGAMGQADESNIKENISKRAGWSNVPAIKSGKIFVVNEDLFYRAGPRLIDGLEKLYE
ncbi:unnamed protein product, partial [marine sediment metagenome]